MLELISELLRMKETDTIDHLAIAYFGNSIQMIPKWSKLARFGSNLTVMDFSTRVIVKFHAVSCMSLWQQLIYGR